MMLTFPVSATADPFVLRIPVAPFTVRPPPTVSPKLLAVVSSVPVTVRRPAVPIAEARLTVPVIVRLLKSFERFRIRTVVAAPLIVTVEVPAAKMEPAPDVSQFPLTVHAPVVRVKVPDVPPVIARLLTETVDAFAVSTPALPIASAPPVRPRLAVARVVVPVPPWTVSVPAHRSAFVLIVSVTVLEPELNVTLPPNSCARLPKVIVCEADELNVMPAAKLQEAEVERSVQALETIHAPAAVDVM